MAKRFRFRLDGVLKVRTQERDEQRRVVAGAMRAVTNVERHIDDLNEALRAALDQARSGQWDRTIDVRSLRAHHVHRAHLHRRILQWHATLGEKQSVLNAERAKLAEASKRLKVIETLREKQWNRHRVEINREEQAAADEVAVQRYLRARDGPGREDRS